MKTILLCSGTRLSELEYARMLELELSDKGFSVLRTEESSEYSAEIIVFDEISETEAERLGGTANEAGIPVICCAAERTDSRLRE